MKSALKASVMVAVCSSLLGTSAFAQSILNQSKDDLLKDFDVGKSLTAPPVPQFSGTANPPPPATWAPKTPPGAAAQSQPAPAPQSQDGSRPQTQPGLATHGASAPPSTQPLSPQAAGLIGNYTQGPDQNPQQKRLLQRIIEGAMNAVNVSNSEANGTHVKVPFVDVNVGGPDGVRVKAPFVKYNCDEGAQVKAPFVKYNSADGAKIKAPFVNINQPSSNQDSSLK